MPDPPATPAIGLLDLDDRSITRPISLVRAQLFRELALATDHRLSLALALPLGRRAPRPTAATSHLGAGSTRTRPPLHLVVLDATDAVESIRLLAADSTIPGILTEPFDAVRALRHLVGAVPNLPATALVLHRHLHRQLALLRLEVRLTLTAATQASMLLTTHAFTSYGVVRDADGFVTGYVPSVDAPELASCSLAPYRRERGLQYPTTVAPQARTTPSEVRGAR